MSDCEFVIIAKEIVVKVFTILKDNMSGNFISLLLIQHISVACQHAWWYIA